MLGDGDVVKKWVKEEYEVRMLKKGYYVGGEEKVRVKGSEVEGKRGEVYDLDWKN